MGLEDGLESINLLKPSYYFVPPVLTLRDSKFCLQSDLCVLYGSENEHRLFTCITSAESL